jgi:Predicted membrane protein
VNRGSLLNRTEQAAIGVAAASVPISFQRTLMPRSNIDQALVTGLSLTANHAIASLIQDTIAAGALTFVIGVTDDHERRWGQTTLGLDLAVVVASVAVQRTLRQTPREPMLVSTARTGAWFAGVAAGAATLVGSYQEARAATGRPRLFPVGIPITMIGTAATESRRRRLGRLNEGLPVQDIKADALQSFAMSLGVTGAGLGISAATRAVADVIGGGLSRVLPGTTAFWRPVGRVAVLGGIAAVSRIGARKVLGGIERKEESFEAAFDLPPPVREVSGSSESPVKFPSLARQGRRFVWNVLRPDAIAALMDTPAVATPIRAYVGLESAASEDARVALALAELERTGAFDRAWLMFASPTGTGYVNYAAVGALECLSRGDCATIAMQYAARPSVLSLDRVGEGRLHAAKLIPAIGKRLAEIPADRRPKFVVFGESLGAWTSQDAFASRGTAGLVADGVDHAIWIGTPHLSKWKEQVLYDDGPEIFLRAPGWLGPPATRPSRVPKGMRWIPTTTFFQGLIDMKNSATVVPGQFDAKGHDYRRDLVPFFNAVLGFDEPQEVVDHVIVRLETQELNRTKWIASHTGAGSSLAAAVAIRWMEEERKAGRDPDAALEASVRALVAEMDRSSASSSPS